MGLDQYSDYGSGTSTNSSSSWACRDGDSWSSVCLPRTKSELLDPKSSSYHDLVMGRCTLDDVMREFRMNGSDSPYNPDEERIWGRQPEVPYPAYLRQKSWPAAERATPAPRVRPHSLHAPLWLAEDFTTSTPVFDDVPPAPFVPEVAESIIRGNATGKLTTIPRSTMHSESTIISQHAMTPESIVPRGAMNESTGHWGTVTPERTGTAVQDTVTREQSLVLSSLPDSVLYSLLRGMQQERRAKLPQECRFCKNNGERESYYRGHALKDASGRVSCPVLRAFVCRRCGARGDRAHTIKYCPLSTNEERIKSAAMMRSVRMASGRRRHSLAPPVASTDYLVFGEPAPPVAHDTDVFNVGDTPLDPLWAALEQKLSL